MESLFLFFLTSETSTWTTLRLFLGSFALACKVCGRILDFHVFGKMRIIGYCKQNPTNVFQLPEYVNNTSQSLTQ